MSVTPIIKLLLDIVCFIAVPIVFVLFYKLAKPFHRGFYCDDDSIRYPYKKLTVTIKLLALLIYIIPTALILLIEGINFAYLKYRKQTPSSKIIGNRQINPCIWNSLARLGIFNFGAVITLIATYIGKYTTGHLRPNFIAVCLPNLPEPCHHMYIENYTCMGNNTAYIKEARLSFPSGHASLSAYSMIFLVIYIQTQVKWKGNDVLLKPLIQFMAISNAFYIGLSRVPDYHHHWSDVLAGFFLGTVIAILITFFVSDLIHSYKKTGSIEEPTLHVTSTTINSSLNKPSNNPSNKPNNNPFNRSSKNPSNRSSNNHSNRPSNNPSNITTLSSMPSDMIPTNPLKKEMV